MIRLAAAGSSLNSRGPMATTPLESETFRQLMRLVPAP